MCCLRFLLFFFFKQKTAYEMRISDWSSDVCSSDLLVIGSKVPGYTPTRSPAAAFLLIRSRPPRPAPKPPVLTHPPRGPRPTHRRRHHCRHCRHCRFPRPATPTPPSDRKSVV